MKSKENHIIIWAFVALILFIWTFNWIQNNSKKFIQECFTTSNFLDRGTPETNHTVNLPLNDTLSCSNMCGPLARCYKTGTQCTSDNDCFGCNPFNPDEEYQINYMKDYRGQNSGGKLSFYAPQYSVLTTDIGTKAKLVADKNRSPVKLLHGVNTWRDTFDEGQKLFDKRYYSGATPFTPVYPERNTLSGEFIDNGPLAANAFL